MASCRRPSASTGPSPSSSRAAARIAVETAAALDQRLEAYSPALLEEIYAYNPRWVVRAMHRGEHLDEADAALRAKTSATNSTN